MPHTYDHPRMAVTADVALFAGASDSPDVLLIARRKPPFQGKWALPGGFVDMDETIAAAAARELAEETGVETADLRFGAYFDAIDRDPRGRTLSLAFWGWLGERRVTPKPADDAADARWFPTADLPPLAFDHRDIVNKALSAYRASRERRQFDPVPNGH